MTEECSEDRDIIPSGGGEIVPRSANEIMVPRTAWTPTQLAFLDAIEEMGLTPGEFRQMVEFHRDITPALEGEAKKPYFKIHEYLDDWAQYKNWEHRLFEINSIHKPSLGNKIEAMGLRWRIGSKQPPTASDGFRLKALGLCLIATGLGVTVVEAQNTLTAMPEAAVAMKDWVLAYVPDLTKIDTSKFVPNIRSLVPPDIVPPNPSQAFDPVWASRDVNVDQKGAVLGQKALWAGIHTAGTVATSLLTLNVIRDFHPFKRATQRSTYIGPFIGESLIQVGRTIDEANR